LRESPRPGHGKKYPSYTIGMLARQAQHKPISSSK
jgi:hypothetical protein